jgi:hypothetical protein
MAEIATLMNLSPRQVSYSLKGIKSWLAQKKIALKVTPGVGVILEASQQQTHQLEYEFGAKSGLQLILSAGQRQQLLTLLLLTASEPLILVQLQQLAQISRATTLKDLDEIEAWLVGWGMVLLRKPNFGIQVEAIGLVRQQALAALVWGETPFGESLTAMSYSDGLEFSLKTDAGLLPLVQRANQILNGWSTTRVTGQVAYAENHLGGRFTDDAVLHLTLALAILTERVQGGHHLELDADMLAWLQTLAVWPVARMISLRIGWHPSGE